MPLWRDFPDFWDYGGRWDQHLCSDGFVFRDSKTALGIYSTKYDPTQEKTAQQIARFSKKDADRWVKTSAMERSREYWRVQADMLFNPPEAKTDPAILNRQIEFFPKSQLEIIQQLLQEYKQFEQAHCAHEGWSGVYIRKIQRIPVFSATQPVASLEELLGIKAGMAPILYTYGKISGRVKNGFSIQI